MLVLSRKTSETILIGEDIVVPLFRVYGSGGNPSVKLGNQAPPASGSTVPKSGRKSWLIRTRRESERLNLILFCLAGSVVRAGRAERHQTKE